MKILVNPKLNQKALELEIIAILKNSDNAVESSKHIELEERKLPLEYQLSDAQKEAYENFVRSVVSIIYNFGFDVVDEYQSSRSYSYYIQFTPSPYKGFEDEWLELDVKFRLSEHYSINKSVIEQTTPKTEGVLFKSFVVEGVEYDNIAATLLAVKNICKDLKIGDYSKLQ